MSTVGVQDLSEDSVIHQLNELFGNVLNLDIIKSVAVSCKYDVFKSSNKLLEISSTPEKRKYMEDTDIVNKNWPSKSSNTYLSSATSYSPLPVKKSKKCLDIETAIDNINKGYKVLIILRGVPGSGKSFLAKTILENTVGFDANYQLHILSTDDYFYLNRQGVYQYDLRKLDEAHNWNQRRAFQAMSRGFSPVIIDNTNTEKWEMKAYATMAIDYGYILEILEPDTHWCFNDKELTKRNKHGVPRAKIKDMLERYEKNVTPQKLLSAYNLIYKLKKPPQLRLYPPLELKISNDIKNKSDSKLVNSTSLPVLSKQAEINDKTVETINLMDFDDDNDAFSKKMQSTNKNLKSEVNFFSQNGIDNMLMFNDNTETNNVLQPTTGCDKDPFIIITDDEDEAPKENDIYSQLEHAWGIKESTLKSWDIVTPINDIVVNDNTKKIPARLKESAVETTESSCGTEDECFRLLNNDKLTPGHYGDLKVIETVNRDINYLTFKKQPNILLKLTLDKSCMTDDVYEDYDNHMRELGSLFPSVPKSHLSYWYNKCKGDLEWTIDFLLEAKEEAVALIVTEDESNSILPNNQNSNNSDVEESENSNSSNNSNNVGIKINKTSKRKIKKYGHSSSPDDKDEIIKILESKIDISGEYYSKHLLKIKKYNTKSDTNGASTSGSPDAQINNEPIKSEQPDMNVDEIISLDSDFDFDEVENPSEKPVVVEETVELNLGDFFVTQLEEKFADSNIEYPKGFQPVVQMPVALAKQLYSFYIESVYQQMENQQNVLESLISEDEEFARKLQAKEEEETNLTNINDAPNFKQIQEDQQAARNAHKKEVETWKNLNPDTLAAKLTKQKLFSIFPTIPRDTLEEILQAHDNKYTDTVETLLASTESENVHGSMDMIKEPPIKEEILEEMKEAQKNNYCQDSEDREEASFYREQANKYLKKRADLYQKAQQYHQRGMTEVAQFYSGLASLQTSYFDRANNVAAATFLDEHSKRLQDFNTLDLHFLYVKEAIPALDVFLDRNINLLKHSTTKQTEYLQIITGRGNRSENGKSKLRPAVMSRLNKRNIKYVILNPGLLKVKITKNSLVTSDVSTS